MKTITYWLDKITKEFTLYSVQVMRNKSGRVHRFANKDAAKKFLQSNGIKTGVFKSVPKVGKDPLKQTKKSRPPKSLYEQLTRFS